MAALLRVAAVSVAGALLYYAGIVNALVISRPSPWGAATVAIAVGASLTLLLFAIRGDGRTEAGRPWGRRPATLMRFVWLFISLMALVSLAWIYGVPRERGCDWTPYHNDAIALNECAAALIIEGKDPYATLDLFEGYDRLAIGADRTTPLRRGLFADVPIYPSDDQLDEAWALRSRGVGENVEFVWRPSYPALSFLLIVPWVARGWDTNVLYLMCLIAAMSLVIWRAPAGLRPFILTGLLGATSLVAFTIGGSSDLVYALPLVAAWLWRERRWSALSYGVAAATKQIAWFFAPFLFIQWAAALGVREALRRSALSGAVFIVANLPLFAPDPAAWAAGVLTPVVEPMFPRGAGLVFLETNGVVPLLPSAVHLALQAVAMAAALAVAWRTRHTSPELGVVLAAVPLFFAYRSLFSYFFLLPLFAFSGLARMSAGDLRPSAARTAGALTILAAPREPR
ncbi:hypothetical protein BH18CHL2_BH18CHL2_09990 [soil metagenome]